MHTEKFSMVAMSHQKTYTEDELILQYAQDPEKAMQNGIVFFKLTPP